MICKHTFQIKETSFLNSMWYDLMVFFIASNAYTLYTSGYGLINYIAKESVLFFSSRPSNIFTYIEANLVFYWRPTLLTWRPTHFDWSLALLYLEFNQFFTQGQPRFHPEANQESKRGVLLEANPFFNWNPTRLDWSLAPFYLKFNQFFSSRPTKILPRGQPRCYWRPTLLTRGQLSLTGA